MNQGEATTHLTIRKSPFLLLSKIILTETLLALFLFIVIVLIDYLSTQNEINFLQSVEVEFLLFSLMGILLATVGLIVFLNWFNEHIHIYPKLIIHETGLLRSSRREIFLDKFERTEITQDTLGKLFHFGHVGLYFHEGEPITFEFISEPEEFVRIIHSSIGTTY